ncbi:MAG: agmatinase [Chloroflexota bacterium]|nr:agmatinase [Chloroflexota bacterium]
MDSSIFYPRRSFSFPPAKYTDFDSARVVVLPIPYDSTVDWRSGTRDGPNAIIDASHFMEPYDHELGREIYEVGIHTLPELIPSMKGPEETVDRVYSAAKELLEKGKFVVMLGGEHSLTVGAVRAYSERFDNLSVLQLDAHSDLKDEYEGTRHNHACVMRRVIECCPITQVGIRSMSPDEHGFIEQNGLRPFYAGEKPLDDDDVDAIVSTLTDDVYITIDLDAFDPSIMAAVGTPEPGGMGWYEAMQLLKRVASEKRIVGFDVMELAPREGPIACTYLAAKLTYKLIGLSCGGSQ